MDDADRTQERAEKEAAALVLASKRPEGPAPTGQCLWCDEPTTPDRRWCDAECRNQWERNQGASKR